MDHVYEPFGIKSISFDRGFGYQAII